MQKKLTITIDEEVYEGLYEVVAPTHQPFHRGHGTSPRIVPRPRSAYAEMAGEEDREQAALEWAEATVGDAPDETW